MNPYELYAYSTIRVVDAWYIRCNSISCSYTMPEKFLPQGLQNMGFSFSVSNPFQIRSKDFKGRDPEVALGSQPLQRTVSFGINMSFRKNKMRDMKTKILVLLLAWGFIGCDGFLEEKARQKFVHQQFWIWKNCWEGEGYWTDGDATFTDATDIFTDNVTCKVVGKTTLNVKIRDRYKYIWDNSMFDDNGEGADISFWKTPYKYIKGCNVILEYIDDMITDGEEDRVKREHLRGEAYVLRGCIIFIW